ncbi:MAG: hypothetical protein AAFO29_25220, partial [Actinomycetota bacterium]
RARKVAEDDEEDDEDEDDVEADLDAILRDRLAESDDEDEDEESEDGAKPKSAQAASGPGRGEEIVCQSCFLLVNRNQIGRGPTPTCPHCGEPLEI